MKCELCHGHEAETVLFREGKGKRREELYVCRACAERERAFGQERGVQIAAVEADGEGPNPGKPPKGLESLGLPKEVFGQLGEMFGKLSERLSEEMGANVETRCPGCGGTAEDLRASGLMGCPSCYKTFRKPLLALLDEAQQGTEYRGDPFPGRERERELAALATRQREAVAREDYAEAKRLAEEIRRLREEGNGHGA